MNALMRQDVLDRGFVELLNIMPHPDQGISGDQVIVNAARVSYLGESKGEEADKKLLFRLMRDEHTSPFEHVIFQFRVKAPIMVVRQWQRHRTWSYSEQSYRYTEAQDDEFYIPSAKEWRYQSKSNKQGSEGYLPIAHEHGFDGIDCNTQMENAMWGCLEVYSRMIEAGVAREQARLVLPAFALYTTFYATVDAHNLMHFLKLRLHPHAQYEIRVYAEAIWEMFKVFLPYTAQAFEEYVLNESTP